jgi:RNA polymerase sigma-70 factor (ECF subfamily)
MGMGDGERAWIAAAKRGDHTAFHCLVRMHARGSFRVAMRILDDRALAEDAVQDALLHAFRSLDRFDEKSAFATWLYRITVNAALDIRKKRVPRTDQAELAEMPDLSPQPLDVAGAHELGGDVERALEQLTPLERTAFVLRHVEQFSLEEIAAALESNVNRTKQAIFARSASCAPRFRSGEQTYEPDPRRRRTRRGLRRSPVEKHRGPAAAGAAGDPRATHDAGRHARSGDRHRSVARSRVGGARERSGSGARRRTRARRVRQRPPV